MKKKQKTQILCLVLCVHRVSLLPSYGREDREEKRRVPNREPANTDVHCLSEQ